MWNESCEVSFQDLKRRLVSALVLIPILGEVSSWSIVMLVHISRSKRYEMFKIFVHHISETDNLNVGHHACRMLA